MQKEFLLHAYAAKRIGLLFAPNNLVRVRVEHLYKELERELGPAPTFQEIQSYAVLPFGLLTRLKLKYDVFTQSPPRRHEYNLPERTLSWATPKALVSKLADNMLRPRWGSRAQS
jgi:hypothetical protein